MIDVVYRLKYIIRYSNYPRVTNEDVAQHSFFVSALCVELASTYQRADLGRMLLMATVHDWPEVFVDDVSHAVKRDFPMVAKALKAAEMKVMKQFSPIVQDAYREYEEQKTLEAKLVKLADTKQCLQYLNNELDLGNIHIRSLYTESMKLVSKLKGEIQDDYDKRLHSVEAG